MTCRATSVGKSMALYSTIYMAVIFLAATYSNICGSNAEKVTLGGEQLAAEIRVSMAYRRVYFPSASYYNTLGLFGCVKITAESLEQTLVEIDPSGKEVNDVVGSSVNVSNYIGTSRVLEGNLLTKFPSGGVSPVELSVDMGKDKPAVWFGMMVEASHTIQDAAGLEVEFEGKDWRGTIPMANMLQHMTNFYEGIPGHHGGFFSISRRYGYFYFRIDRGLETVKFRHVGFVGRPERYSVGHFCFGNLNCPSCDNTLGNRIDISTAPWTSTTTTTAAATTKGTESVTTSGTTPFKSNNSTDSDEGPNTVGIAMGAAAGGLAAAGLGGGIWYMFRRAPESPESLEIEAPAWNNPEHRVVQEVDTII